MTKLNYSHNRFSSAQILSKTNSPRFSTIFYWILIGQNTFSTFRKRWKQILARIYLLRSHRSEYAFHSQNRRKQILMTDSTVRSIFQHTDVQTYTSDFHFWQSPLPHTFSPIDNGSERCRRVPFLQLLLPFTVSCLTMHASRPARFKRS
jgi:hypothetical protein